MFRWYIITIMLKWQRDKKCHQQNFLTVVTPRLLWEYYCTSDQSRYPTLCFTTHRDRTTVGYCFKLTKKLNTKQKNTWL